MSGASTEVPPRLLPELRCFVLIVGSSRSGSTLLGAVIDGHPQAIVANESGDSMTLWRGLNRDEVLDTIVARAAVSAANDRSSTGYRYQIGPHPAVKQGVLVVGDKTWNPTLLLLHGNPTLLSSLEERLGVPVRLIHAIRSPFDVIATMHRRSGMSVRDRSRWYFMHCEAAEALRERLPRESFLESHHADLVTDPVAEVGRLGRFLGLPHDEAHVSAVQGLLFEQPRRTAEGILWSAADVDAIVARMAAFACLSRYGVERPRVDCEPPSGGGGLS